MQILFCLLIANLRELLKIFSLLNASPLGELILTIIVKYCLFKWDFTWCVCKCQFAGNGGGGTKRDFGTFFHGPRSIFVRRGPGIIQLNAGFPHY
jgi:hypothetical protein